MLPPTDPNTGRTKLENRKYLPPWLEPTALDTRAATNITPLINAAVAPKLDTSVAATTYAPKADGVSQAAWLAQGTLNATFVPKPAGITDGQSAVWNAATSTWVAVTPSTVGTAAALSIVFGG